MLTRLLRRAFGLMTAASVAVLPFLSQPAPAAASAAGSLFALVQSSAAVATLDPSTGAMTTIADLSLPATQPQPFFSTMASDPANHRLYVVRAVFAPDFSSITNQLLTIDTQAGGFTVGPTLLTGITDLVFDTSSGTLYGQDQMCCPFHEVRIDTSTGGETIVADLPGVQPLFPAINSSTHTIYLDTESFVLGQPQPVNQIASINASVVNGVNLSPAIATGVFALAYDSSSGALLGKTFCCPNNLVKVDPTSGLETPLGTQDVGFSPGMAIDASSHTLYAVQQSFGPGGAVANILTLDDQTGALLAHAPLPAGTNILSLAFEAPPITPESIKADVQAAFASGAITKNGIAHSLLAKLDHAEAARARGQCGVAANAYGAFINEVEAQSGKAIAPATATHLISEAQFLIANCP